MPIINTDLDWWNAVENNWDLLLQIIAHRLDLDHAAYETPGDDTVQETGRTVAEELDFLRKNRDEKIARYFHAAWGLASETYAWSVQGWSVLCDLCSEECVLYPEPTDEEIEAFNAKKASVDFRFLNRITQPPDGEEQWQQK